MNSPRLKYQNMVAGNADGKSMLLRGCDIPVHPKVLSSKKCFTPEFGQKVTTALQDEIARQIQALQLDTNADAVLSSTTVEYNFDNDKAGVNTGYSDMYVYRKGRGNSGHATGYKIDKPEIWKGSYSFPNPLPENVLQAYAAKGIIKTWQIHNHYDEKTPLDIIMRSFAVAFNNLGLDEVEKDKPWWSIFKK